MNTRDIVEIFNRLDITSITDENRFKFSSLGGITNTNLKVEIDDKKYVLRVPGDNPDLINRKSEGLNEELIQSLGISLPLIIFEEDTGIKITEFFDDLYTFNINDMLDKKHRDYALDLLITLHNSDIKFKENFSPLNVFSELVLVDDKVEYEAKTIGVEIVKNLSKIGLDSKPCHQDLYHANFVYFNEKAYLIDWEYSSQGDPLFDYADLIWQNELDQNSEVINDIYSKIGINDDRTKTKMELFQILSMITWGFWAKRKSPKENRGQEALISAIKKYDNNFS
tara:strand:- start:932 stop:1777 length:846 start_codon:yes stop_codon:yes gene_type:complete